MEKKLSYIDELKKLVSSLSDHEKRLVQPVIYKTEAEAKVRIALLESLGFVRCPEGNVTIGNEIGLICSIEGHRANETPTRDFKIDSFYIRKTTITNVEYEEFDSRHSRTNTSRGDKNPVTCITYGRAVSFILWLNQKTGMNFSLPSEPQLYKALAPEGWQFPYQKGGKPVKRNQNVYLSYPELYPQGELGSTLEVDNSRIPTNYLGLYHPTGNVSVFTLGHYITEGHWGSVSDGAYSVAMGGNFRICAYGSRTVTRGIIDVTGIADTIGIRLAHPDPLNYVE